MSITAKWLVPNNLGNALFQYCFVRLFARKNGLALETRLSVPWSFPVSAPAPGRRLREPVVRIFDLPRRKLAPRFRDPCPPARYVVEGYFQDPTHFVDHREEIRGFFPGEPPQAHPEDVCMHLRLGDYATHLGGVIISPEWYLRILKGMRFRRLYIFGAKRSEPYLRAFERFRPEIMEPGLDPMRDFHQIRGFSRVILSNSTFCWWACFLGRARETYVFKRWCLPPGMAENPDSFLMRLSQFPGARRVPGDFADYRPTTYYALSPRQSPPGAGWSDRVKSIFMLRYLSLLRLLQSLRRS